jgi:putative transposase
VSLNPVRARLVAGVEDWPWSSVRAHVNGAEDGLVTVCPVLDRIPHFAKFLSTTEDQDFGDLRLAEGSGRPVGTADFVTGLERLLGSPIARRAPGRKPAASVTGVGRRILVENLDLSQEGTAEPADLSTTLPRISCRD